MIVMSLIWQHSSTSEGHLQANSIIYINGIVYNCIKFELSLSLTIYNVFYQIVKLGYLSSKLNIFVHNLFYVLCTTGPKMIL